MIRTQISFDNELYEKAKQLSKKWGVSLAELCRQGLEHIINREPSDKPWMSYAGLFEGKSNDSSSVDEVVYDREKP